MICNVEKLLESVIIGNIISSIDETLLSLINELACVTKYDWNASAEEPSN